MGTDSQNIEFRDWLILDSLSDDYECVEQIVHLVHNDWPNASPLEIIDRLERLYYAGFVFLAPEATFNRVEMIYEVDQTRDRRFWFGRTPSGDTLWQQSTANVSRS